MKTRLSIAASRSTIVAICLLLLSPQAQSLHTQSAAGLSSELALTAYSNITDTPLVLDPHQIAGRRIAPPTWMSESVESNDIREWPIEGWQLAQVDASSASTPAERIRGLVDRIAERSPDGFASPVFIGRDGGPVFVTPTLLVAFDENYRGAWARTLLEQFGELDIESEDWADMPGAYKLTVKSSNAYRVLDIAADLASRSGVTYAEPDWIFTGSSGYVPNDLQFDQQWGLNNLGQSGGTPDIDMNGPEAWDFTQGNSSVNVVVIDTGVEQGHNDLTQLPGSDLTSEGPGDGGPINQFDNHGTAVAGCVSATINNGFGVSGIAPLCNSVSARTFISINSSGNWTGQPSWTVDALTFAQSVNARVTNNSNQYGFTSSAVASKYQSTLSAGMIHFASAGNNASQNATYPSTLSSVLAIGSITRTGALSGFSNFGTDIAFTAPGSSIRTTDRSGSAGYTTGDFATVQGTSFASPYAAGVAALLLSLDPTLGAFEITAILQGSVKDLGVPGPDTTFGAGLVDAHAALVTTGLVFDGLDSWGWNSAGQVSATPGGKSYTQISAGGRHSIALRNDQSITSWGFDGSLQVSSTPLSGKFTAVSAGSGHSLALRVDGSIESWGRDIEGQVSFTPLAADFKQVNAGRQHSVALHKGGSISSWGLDAEGQVTGTPTEAGFIKVAAGFGHSLAIRSDGSIESWGSDSAGQIALTPQGGSFIDIDGGEEHSVALRSDGSIVSWGADDFGQVSKTPPGFDFVQVAAGLRYSMALRADGTIVSWGIDDQSANDFGQVSQAPTSSGYMQIDAGDRHGVAITSSAVVCQTDLGYRGPGTSVLSMCGSALATGQTSNLLLIDGRPNAIGWLVVSGTNTPTPFLGGTLIPIPALKLIQIKLKADGSLNLPGITGGGGPVTAFLQLIYLDSSFPEGLGISNALELSFLP
ncbi:MAG: subtilisin family serine protease [Planctomycetota bacterium]|jgi:subtilisin family serine protease